MPTAQLNDIGKASFFARSRPDDRDRTIHRDDGPAIEGADGTKAWYRDGELHRDDGPAVEWPDGSQWWLRNGKLYRENGHAVDYVGGPSGGIAMTRFTAMMDRLSSGSTVPRRCPDQAARSAEAAIAVNSRQFDCK